MTPISPLKICKDPDKESSGHAYKRDQRGMTLIEILIVMVILAGMASYAIPRIFRNQDNVKKISRQFSGLTKEVRNRAKLKNATMRLVIDMRAEPHRYWVEMTQGSRPIESNLYEKKDKTDEEEKPRVVFHKDELLIKKERELPTGWSFAAVETVNMKTPITQGVAYIHFFPEGFVEASVIQITNKKGITWTLAFSPLTGQVDIYEEAKFLADMKK